LRSKNEENEGAGVFSNDEVPKNMQSRAKGTTKQIGLRKVLPNLDSSLLASKNAFQSDRPELAQFGIIWFSPKQRARSNGLSDSFQGLSIDANSSSTRSLAAMTQSLVVDTYETLPTPADEGAGVGVGSYKLRELNVEGAAIFATEVVAGPKMTNTVSIRAETEITGSKNNENNPEDHPITQRKEGHMWRILRENGKMP
jgi:hypothetical protein